MKSGHNGEEEFQPPNAREYADILAVDVVGQYWMAMLVPLNEPQTIVFDLQKDSFESQGAITVKAFVPGCPVFTLWFHEKSNLLGQITYLHDEAGSRIHKRMTLGEYKPHEGIQLPNGIAFYRNGEVVEQWEVNSWEFLDTIEDSSFDRPKAAP